MNIEECPKCKSDKGYFFKNTGSFKELHGFDGLVKVIADGKDQGIILKTHKQKVRAMKVLRGIKLVTATEEDILKYNG